MIKRFVGTVVTAAALAVTGKLVSDYAETKPALKNVKDKLKKTGEDFASNCKKFWMLQDVFLQVKNQMKTK